MYLIPVPDLPSIFSVFIKIPRGSRYEVKVTVDTTIELLLKSLQTYLKNEKHNYKLVYGNKDTQNADTLKKLKIGSFSYVNIYEIHFCFVKEKKKFMTKLLY